VGAAPFGSIGMIWDSWNDFIAMGGYGRYVWGSLAAVA
jgi:heme exporter protein D